MSEVSDALAIAIEALEEFAPSVTDATLAERIQRVKQSMEELQLDLDNLVN